MATSATKVPAQPVSALQDGSAVLDTPHGAAGNAHAADGCRLEVPNVIQRKLCTAKQHSVERKVQRVLELCEADVSYKRGGVRGHQL